MSKKSYVFLIVILLLVSCGNSSRQKRQSNRQAAQTEKPAEERRKIDTLIFSRGEEYVVKVVGITDGDTFTGLTADYKQVTCRIFGIDAPERRQAFSNRAKQKLSDLIFGKQVKIKIQGRHFKRAVVWVYTPDGKDVALEMLRAGLAWHYKQFSKDVEYAELEDAARQRKIGLWADKNPIEPWNYRKK